MSTPIDTALDAELDRMIDELRAIVIRQDFDSETMQQLGEDLARIEHSYVGGRMSTARKLSLREDILNLTRKYGEPVH
jgi:hypothetical protein